MGIILLLTKQVTEINNCKFTQHCVKKRKNL